LSPINTSIAVDLRGHGLSASGPPPWTIERLAEDVASLVGQLALPAPILVGHSLGCRVVLQAARSLGRQLLGVVLLDGNLDSPGNPDKAEGVVRRALQKYGYRKVIKNA